MYQNGNVSIDNSVAAFGATKYPVRNIASVRRIDAIEVPNPMPWKSALATALLGLSGLSAISKDIVPAFALILLAVPFGWYAKNQFGKTTLMAGEIKISTAAGEVRAFESTDNHLLVDIENALVAAIGSR
jgi:prepilin signal peptidase PulO-like enzyme (type II secretory pathway)